MNKSRKKILSINSPKNLAFINTIIFGLIALIMYVSLPSILNYPPNSIDNDFQIEIVGIKYSTQYLILISILMLFVYVTLRIFYQRLSLSHIKDPNNLTEKEVSEIIKIRKKCFNYPYLLLLIETFIPAVITAILLFIFNSETELVIRISIVIFSLSAVFASISFMVCNNFFSSKLIETSKLVDNEANGVRLNIDKKLVFQILPLFLLSFVLILLINLSKMTEEKSNLLFNSYKGYLLQMFSDDQVYDLDEARNLLESVNLQYKDDHIFLISAETGEVYYSKENLNDFLITYTLNFYDISQGHTYEYYGRNIEGVTEKISTPQGDYYAGIRYHVFAPNFILTFMFIAFILIMFDLILIIYIGKNISKNISNIVDGLNLISNSNDIMNANELALTSHDEIGDLTVAFNNVQTLSRHHVDQIHSNQDMLIEKERLASLGQMIGGIAHNLKTPIMSVAGASQGILDLISEYRSSVGDPDVTTQDHMDIAKDMEIWVEKIKTHIEYMSDVITAVKGQAVALSNSESNSFTIEELIKYVNVLMKHELNNALVTLNINSDVDPSIQLQGNINSLVQVIDNIISNAIQAYEGKPNQSIDLNISTDNNNVSFSIVDYGIGMNQQVQDKLFKEMITTKGKDGTGLGLFMSYSNIRAHFNGNITFESEEGKGTTFNIIIPI